jgi:CRISPR-associated protein Cas1
MPNQGINHAATAVQGAAAIAVQALAAIPQLGFIHEDSGQAFRARYRRSSSGNGDPPIAFTAAKKSINGDETTIDRLVRREASTVFRKQDVIASMIDKIKLVLRTEENDGAGSHSDA